MLPNVVGEGAWDKYKNLKRLVDEINARPAAQKANALKDRHKFKTGSLRVFPQLGTHAVKPLAVLSLNCTPTLPDIPTADEQ